MKPSFPLSIGDTANGPSQRLDIMLRVPSPGLGYTLKINGGKRCGKMAELGIRRIRKSLKAVLLSVVVLATIVTGTVGSTEPAEAAICARKVDNNVAQSPVHLLGLVVFSADPCQVTTPNPDKRPVITTCGERVVKWREGWKKVGCTNDSEWHIAKCVPGLYRTKTSVETSMRLKGGGFLPATVKSTSKVVNIRSCRQGF